MVIDKRWKSHKGRNLGHLLLPLSYEAENIGDLEIYYPRTIDPDISIKGPHKVDDRTSNSFSSDILLELKEGFVLCYRTVKTCKYDINCTY